jgi:hypothetical protein
MTVGNVEVSKWFLGKPVRVSGRMRFLLASGRPSGIRKRYGSHLEPGQNPSPFVQGSLPLTGKA